MAAEAKPDGSSVVILGAWNPAILQPVWLVSHVFGGNPAQTPIETEISMVANQPPRFTIHGIRFVPGYDKLQVAPGGLDAQSLAACEEKIRAVLLALPHTPISAVGINFLFTDDEPSDGLLALFTEQEALAEVTNLQFETRSTGFMRAMAMNGYVLNLTRSLASNNQVSYKFNYHYPVTDAAAAANLFNGGMAANFATAQVIVDAYNAM